MPYARRLQRLIDARLFIEERAIERELVRDVLEIVDDAVPVVNCSISRSAPCSILRTSMPMSKSFFASSGGAPPCR